MPNPFDQFDSKGGNPFDQFDGRKTPKQMKIGAEGFGDAFEKVMEETPKWAKNLAAGATFPRELYEGAKQLFGKEDPQAIRAQRILEDKDPIRSLAGGLGTVALSSLIPGGGSALGQTLLGTATGAVTPVEKDESRLTNTLLGFGLSAGGNLAMRGLGGAAARWAGSSGANAADTAMQHSVRDATLSEARNAGYVVPRSSTGEGGAGTKAIESIAGKAATSQEASIRNQQVTNRIARQEAGLKENEPIVESSLKAARERLAEPYRQISALSSKAAKAVEDMKQARAESKTYWRHHDMTGDPKSLKTAEKFDAKALAAEKAIEAEATRAAMGQSSQAKGLVERLREARTALAKNYQVERAVNLGNGNVDAAVIGKMFDKVGEEGMTGGLRTIGKFQQAFPDFSRIKPSGQSAPGIGALKPYAAALGIGIGAEEAHRNLGLSPYMMGAAALPLIGGPARRLALSELMQGAPKYGPSTASRSVNFLANDPLMRTLPLMAVDSALDAQR